MKPARFEYHRPGSPAEAAAMLAEYDDAAVVAGNQTLGMDMSYREVEPDHLVDVSTLDLSFVDVNGDALSIGATTLHRTLARSERLADRFRALSEAASKVADPSVRSVGTFGGSLGKAHPASNYPTVLRALDTTLTVRSPEGTRESDFDAYLTDGLADDEFIESATAHVGEFAGADAGSAFIQFKRARLTWPTVNAAAAVRVEDGVVTAARVGLANVAPTHVRVRDAEAAVVDTELDDAALAEASEAALAAVDPAPELHADDGFKREMAGEYATRALGKAYQRATD
jgi:carbon-monoxide dehydrogenase medium subunit